LVEQDRQTGSWRGCSGARHQIPGAFIDIGGGGFATHLRFPAISIPKVSSMSMMSKVVIVAWMQKSHFPFPQNSWSPEPGDMIKIIAVVFDKAEKNEAKYRN